MDLEIFQAGITGHLPHFLRGEGVVNGYRGIVAGQAVAGEQAGQYPDTGMGHAAPVQVIDDKAESAQTTEFGHHLNGLRPFKMVQGQIVDDHIKASVLEGKF